MNGNIHIASEDLHKAADGRPSKLIIMAMSLILVFSLGLFGIVEVLNTKHAGLEAISLSLRDAATSLLVGATIALIFEIVVQRRASKASELVVRRSLAPISSFLSSLQIQLEDLHQKARATVELSHVMTVAQHTGIADIFENRRELFEKEIKARLAQADVKRILMVGVSLRDFFAGDSPLYETMTALNEKIRSLNKCGKEAPEVLRNNHEGRLRGCRLANHD